ncbi:MAG: Unknown protein [uncultured Sulfurovum sp.]|uniref:Uncharacterized protein n=1 Tax=uncultured Sulfurovum sp. TaxID=269237 RepID=A0A6S6U7T1_9BACT|nr:MAG: Unknown protein [uncultured Sulfurovum sp.]
MFSLEPTQELYLNLLKGKFYRIYIYLEPTQELYLNTSSGDSSTSSGA